MKQGVTIQDIAEFLQLSRNTVSKALNGHYVPPRTKRRILDAAISMGYKSYAAASASVTEHMHRKIMLLSSRLLLNIDFYVFIMRGIESALEEYNMELLQFHLSPTTPFSRLEQYLRNFEIDGIICMEFFSAKWIPQLVELGYPMIFLDFPYNLHTVRGHYDILLMESFEILRDICSRLIENRVCRTFGFVGDYRHCRSFYERFLGMREAVFLAGLDYDPACSVTEDDSFPYGEPEMLRKRLNELPTLPECFVCANDTIALSLLRALELSHIDVPKQVSVLGFDNIAPSKTASPALSTFNVDKVSLGKSLISILFERIKEPSQKSRVIYIKSKPILRQTTTV